MNFERITIMARTDYLFRRKMFKKPLRKQYVFMYFDIKTFSESHLLLLKSVRLRFIVKVKKSNARGQNYIISNGFLLCF